jgi:hypothetical protein
VDAPTKGALLIGGAAAGFTLLAVLLKRSSAAPAPARGPSRIALIGDSFAVGLGPPLQHLYAPPTLFQYEGETGTTPKQWATATGCGPCGSWLPAWQPTIVLVSLGMNDYANPHPDAAYYQTIAEGIASLGATCVWLEPPSVPKSPLTAVRAIIESLGVPVIKAPAGLPIGADGVHPVSYAPWAAAIAQQVT